MSNMMRARTSRNQHQSLLFRGVGSSRFFFRNSSSTTEMLANQLAVYSAD